MDDDDRDIEETPPPAFRTGQVRIIGAEPAGQSAPGAREEPAPPGEAEPFDVAAGTGEPEPGASSTGHPDLLHWTEAPTGEVPSVLARRGEEGGEENPWADLPGPTWREGESDWDDDEGAYEPSMLATDEGRLGSLDDSGESQRQPWTFDLPGRDDAPSPAAAGPSGFDFGDHSDDDTVVVPAVGPLGGSEDPAALGPDAPGRPGASERSVVVGDVDAGVRATDADELLDDATLEPTARPSRVGRARRKARPEPAVVAPAAAAPVARAVAKSPPGVGGSRRAGGLLNPPRAPGEAKRSGGGRDMPIAVISGVILAVIVIVFFDLGTITAMLIVTAVVFLGTAETYAAFRKGGYQPATLLGLVATLSLMIATYNKGQAALGLVLALLVGFTFIWYLAGVERGADPVRGTGATLFVFCWVGVLGSFSALLLNPNLFPHRHGIAFLLGAVITAVAYDIGALFLGGWMGSHPVAPSISPNKTWEGLVGGAVAAILAGVIIVHFIHPWTIGTAAELGVIVAIVSPIGDFSESLVKRTLGIKDMGRLLPGHGGILDRVDGMLFVLPATYFLVRAAHLG
jgi:phosphatidate cytidylyltransferase